jgi:hypothetical protein
MQRMDTLVSTESRRQFLLIGVSGVAIFVALFVAKMVT